VAILVAAGVVLTHLFVLRAGEWAATKRWLQPALVAVGVTALLQLLATASDISGKAVWRSLSSVDQAVELTDAGAAYMVRIAVAICAWLVLVHTPPKVAHVRNELLVMISTVFLATWSFAGHSSSMRWPALGIPLDVIHHGAAAAWLGGLVIVGLVALPVIAPDEVHLVMRRFSRMATAAVIAIVSTGLVQAVRLVGGPGQLLEANHGKLLVAKVAALACMLALADANRRRLTTRLRSVGVSEPVDVAGLRRGMLIELVVGLVIIGITAAMVVSPPVTSAGLAAP
jgi:copper transport protein